MNLCWPNPQYQRRDDLHTTTQNLADEPTLADGAPAVPEERWLAYHYTKLGRWTYVGQWTGPPTPHSVQSRDFWIPVHKTWQMNLLWLMAPPVPEERWLAYHYTKFSRWTYVGWWTPLVPEKRWLAYHYTKLGRWTYIGKWTPLPGTIGEMLWIPVHKTWQMNLLWPMDPPVSQQRCLAYHYTKLGRWTYFGWTQWQRFESSSIHCFWDSPLHFLKTCCFSLESGFPLFLELQ